MTRSTELATPPDLPGADHRYVRVNGFRMHVVEAGAGPPLLLLHGWPQHWWMWRDLIGPLGSTHRVICPDLRGLGWSEAPRTGYGRGELARDLLALLDALEVPAADVVAHDWGLIPAYWVALFWSWRAQRQAAGLGHDQIEFIESDVHALPFEEETFDLAVTYNGLHCLPDPQAALTEIVRCIKVGGHLAGCATVLGTGRRQDILYRAYQRAGIFGAGLTADELNRWLLELELEDVSLDRSGAWVHFVAQRVRPTHTLSPRGP